MVVELKAKSQVTVPAPIVSSLGLNRGDLFDVVVENGRIILIPVVAYPKEYVEKLEREARSASGKSEAFSDVDTLIASLEGE